MKNVLVAIALEEEGLFFEKTIQEFNNYFNIEVLYTGVGPVNATFSLMNKIMEYKLKNIKIDDVINLGSAGGRGNDINIADVIECNGFIARDVDQSALGFPLGIMHPESIFEDDRVVVMENKNILTDLPKAICGSGSNFETKDIPFKNCKVLDMEAAALMKVCIRKDIPFSSFKYISDVKNDEDKDHNEGEQWKNNVQNTSVALNEALKMALNRLKNA